jgi:hypothetical protein
MARFREMKYIFLGFLEIRAAVGRIVRPKPLVMGLEKDESTTMVKNGNNSTGRKKPVQSARGEAPDWRKRRTHQKIRHFIGALFFMALLGVLTGLTIVHWPQLKNKFGKTPQTLVNVPTKVKTSPSIRIPDPQDVKDKTPVDSPNANIPDANRMPANGKSAVPVPGTGKDDAQGRLFLSKGKQLLSQLQFEAAGKAFADAEGLTLSDALRNELKVQKEKVKQFHFATKHISSSPFAVKPDAVRFNRVGGMQGVGFIHSGRKPGNCMVEVVYNPAATGSQKFEVPENELESRPYPLEDRKNWFRGILRDAASDFNPASGTDYYDMIYLSKRLSLEQECLDYLEKAYSMDSHIGDSFRKKIMNDRLSHAALLLAAGRPKMLVEDVLKRMEAELSDFQQARDEAESFRMDALAKVKDTYKPTLQVSDRPKTVVALAPPPSTSSTSVKSVNKATENSSRTPITNARKIVADAIGAEQAPQFDTSDDSLKVGAKADPLVRQANDLYRKGLDVWRGIPNMNFGSQRNARLDEGIRIMDQATELYMKALDFEENNMALENRATEANMILYAMRKTKGVR